jgi:hypothetical protein
VAKRLLATAVATLVLGVAAAGDAANVEVLADALLRSENYKVRLKAATALGQVQGPDAVRTLLTALGDPHPLVRAAAANALGRHRNADTLPDLCRMRGDADAFVRRAADGAIAVFGGPSKCEPKRVYVSVEVSGDDEATAGFVRTRMLERCAGDRRVVLGRTVDLTGAAPSGGPDPRAEVEAGRLAGVELKLRVARTVERSPTTTKVRCEVFQSVYDLRLRALRGSVTQRAEIDLGSPSASAAAADQNARECLGALVPVVYDGFSDYLDRLE